jgi:hypothetical protein
VRLVPRLAALLLAAAVGAALSPAPAGAELDERLGIVDLSVADGEDAWHPVNIFRVDWVRASGGLPVAAAHFQVRDDTRVLVPDTRIDGEVDRIESIEVPGPPGRYWADVWLEGPGGEIGPPATATLRFDDVAPGPARPAGPGAWLAAETAAVLRIGHPPKPLPVSGIRGYAISVDRGNGGAPCQGPARCTVAETDLNGGIHDDTIVLAGLREGVSFARVVAVSASGMRSRAVESIALRVDATFPELALQGLPGGWSSHPVRLTATAADALSGMAAAGSGGPYTALAIDGHAPTVAAGGSVSAMVIGEGVHRVGYYARDAAGNVADGEAGAPAPVGALVRIDETPPGLAFPLRQDPSEPERIEATVTDALSGPDPGRGTIAVRPAGSRQPFAPLPTTVEEGRLLAWWDSDRYPAGSYEFSAVGYDAAGNAGRGDRRLDGARMVLNNPLKAPTELVSGFGGRRLAGARATRYGRGTAFGGRLKAAAGAGLGGLPVLVTETFAAGAEPGRRVTVLHTRPDGAFHLRLPPGPSRRVEASFAGSRLLTRSSAPPSRLEVRSSLRLRSSAATARIGGAPVLFSGRVGRLGTSTPTGGLSVELQFRVAGSAWAEFRSLRTGAAGRFRYPYAFSDDDSRGVRFQIRAHVPAQEGWPYEPANSHPVIVTGL